MDIRKIAAKARVSTATVSRALNNFPNNPGKELGIGLACGHKFRQRLGRIQSDIAALRYRHGRIESKRRQALRDSEQRKRGHRNPRRRGSIPKTARLR